jgi:lambda family phage portal protein
MKLFGLEIKKARKVRTAKMRAYDGASVGRRTDGWMTTGASGAAEVSAGIANLRARSRDLARNNPHAARGLRALTDNIVGEGIRPRSQTGNPALDARVDALFAAWSPWVDVDGEMTYDGLVYRAVRAWLESGDAFARRRTRRPEDGLPVPLQIQLLEADMVPSDLDAATADGGRVVQGIEFDPIGRRRAVHCYRVHPGDNYVITSPTTSLGETTAVPWDSIAHLYDAISARPGQCRGVPWLAPVIRPMRDLDDYCDAERVRKRTEACNVGVVTGGDPDLAPDGIDGIAPALADVDGRPIESMEPGMIAYCRDGKDIRFNTPASVGGFPEYLRSELHAIAAGMSITYELLSGDLSQVNYSSIRAGLIEFRRMVRILRAQVVEPLLCQRIWDWWIDAAVVSGLLPRVDGRNAINYRCKWSQPRFEAVDPQKESDATVTRIRAGLDTLTEALAADGEDVKAVLAERADELRLCDSLGIVLDSDPRSDMTATIESEQPADDETETVN